MLMLHTVLLAKWGQVIVPVNKSTILGDVACCHLTIPACRQIYWLAHISYELLAVVSCLPLHAGYRLLAGPHTL